MKICVSTIVKDEEKFIERWADSARDADLLVVADTGSADDTVEAARSAGVVVHEIAVLPWRFDLARNAALALLPEDVDFVITLDADETLVPGWRDAIENAVFESPDARRLSYLYTWSWLPGLEGDVPDVQFRGDRCVSRSGWRWVGPVHEVLVPAGAETVGTEPVWAGFAIEHYSDDAKPRGGYLPLLEQAVSEEPDNPRQQMYYARELFFAGDWVAARREFVAYLAMPEAVWAAERADAYRYLAKMDDFPERWLLRAVGEDPGRRDAMVDLVDLLVAERRWDEAAGMAARALRIRTRPGDYMTTAHGYDDAYLTKVVAGVARSDGV